MRAVLVAASLALAIAAGEESHAAIMSNGGLMRQQRASAKGGEPVAPWSWVIGDSWEGVAMVGATSPKHSVPLKFCMVHRELYPQDVLCLFAGDSEGVVLKSMIDASEWTLEERQWNPHRPANYTLRLRYNANEGDPFPTPDDKGEEAAGCEANEERTTCCLDSRLPVSLGNAGRDVACSTAMQDGGGLPGNPDCLTTAVRQCEVTTFDGDTSMGWTFMENRLAQRGDCLTRVMEPYLDEIYSISVQPCAEAEDSELGELQHWNLHMKRQVDSDWELVDPQERVAQGSL